MERPELAKNRSSDRLEFAGDGGQVMLALVNTASGSAPIELREVPEPNPARNEALVEVHAFSLNRGELSSFARNEEGWVPGQDIAGVVLRPAANGKGPPAGARVVALVDDRGWAERAEVPGSRMAVLPESVSFSQAATLPVAGLTALRTLRYGGTLIGQRVLITGAAGAVGTLAVQIAAHSGACVTAVVGRPERASGLQALGATEVVEGIDKAQGRFALILESAGGASLAKAVELVEPKGTIVVYGNSSTEPTTLSFANFRGAPNSRLQSFSYFTSEAEERFAPDLALLVSLIANGSLTPRIGVERTWRDILHGLAYAAFALTMTIGRFLGDRIVQHVGGANVKVFGGLCAATGFVLVALVPSWQAALTGYGLVGVGCSNVVPVLFTSVGRQTAMPENVAVPAITTLGYAGILLGPAAIGWVAHAVSLSAAFLILAIGLVGVAAGGRLLRP
jgi:NADPH:quinone reductase-like Zn-dependent oxidoreductase